MKILFVTAHFGNNKTGSAIVMNNLVSELDESIIGGVVTYANSSKDEKSIYENRIMVYKAFHRQFYFPSRLRFLMRPLLINLELKKLIKQIKNESITHVIGVYPDLEFLEFSRRLSIKMGIEFYPYLHDTIKEGRSHKIDKKWAHKIQRKVFKTSKKIFVISEGMKNLYSEKYNLDTIPLVHSFYEDIKKNSFLPVENNSFFVGGSIYGINKETVRRICQLSKDLGFGFVVSAANTADRLESFDFNLREIKILPFLTRNDYIQTVSQQKFLLLSIDWPDESEVHEDELKTIFPTKTIEYLISGRPIVVHCPDHYFLARFFKKHNCGIVVSSRNMNLMKKQIIEALNDVALLREKVMNAFKVSQEFHITKVKDIFQSELN